MTDDQELVSWLGVVLLVMVIFTVYGAQIKAILFNTPAQINPTGQSVSSLVPGYEPATATTTGVVQPTGVVIGSNTGLAA
jgi:hypothetical protein